MRSPKGRLELTWMGKDMALIPTAHGKYGHLWPGEEDRVRDAIGRLFRPDELRHAQG